MALTSSEVMAGLGLLLALSVGCQIVATRLALPAIVLFLPVGFVAGAVTPTVDPNRLFGDSFPPMVSLAVAVILFDGGLGLDLRELEGHAPRVIRRLVTAGVAITWAGAAVAAWLLLDLDRGVAVMLGAILIVSGPTVVAPLLARARPGRRLTSILSWEGTTIDPIGAIIGALVFHALTSEVGWRVDRALLDFAGAIAVGIIGGLIGTCVLWLLVEQLHLTGVLVPEVAVTVVVVVTAVCDLAADDTGLIAAIVMGVAIGNMAHHRHLEHRPFFETIVQLVIGVLFIGISATVTPSSLADVVWPGLALVAVLVVVVRPLVTVVATMGTTLGRRERVFVALVDPRGIVAASTAATFAGPLVAAGIDGADDLLPVTFLVIVGTVTIYGLAAEPAAKALGLRSPAEPASPT